MSKNEFIKILKESLLMSLDTEAIEEQVIFYENYISDEIKKGRTEVEVMDELGDPRLIAKTIKTVNKSKSVVNASDLDENDNNSSYGREYTGNRNRESYNNQSVNNRRYAYVGQTGLIGCVIFLLVAMIIIMAIFRFFGNLAYGVGSLVLSGPIGFFIVIFLIYILFGGGRNRG